MLNRYGSLGVGGLLQSWLLHSTGDAAMTHIMLLEKVWIKKKYNSIQKTFGIEW